MKLSFSTLGCPDLSWDGIFSMAVDLGFDGIEVRGLGNDIFSVKAKPFTEKEIGNTIASLKKSNIEICCLSSNTSLKYADKTDLAISELTQYIELAARLNTPFIRVLGDEHGPVEGEVDDSLVISTLRKLIPLAEKNKVTLLVETNGVYSDTKRLGALLTEINSDYVAALWDVMHPYRNFNESADTTIQNLGGFIKYVHMKDSKIVNGHLEYKFMGEGDMPIPEFIAALRTLDYEGYISLEWVKRWMPELENSNVVFPAYINYMAPYVGKKGADVDHSATRVTYIDPAMFSKDDGILIDNDTKTGKYVWEKEKFINLTFPQVLDRMVKEFPDKIAFKYTELDYTRTYKEFRDDVDEFARGLIALGVKPGSHVAVWATNVPAWYLAFWATTKIGAVLVTVNTLYRIHEIEYLLKQSDTHTLVTISGFKDINYLEIIDQLAPEMATAEDPTDLHLKRLPFLRNVVSVDGPHPGCVTWDEALELGKKIPVEEVYRRASMVEKDDVCNMQYTSGTTGFPKGVMLTHFNVVNNGKCIGDCMNLSSADRMMIQVPMFHCFGMVLAMTASVTHGVSIYPITAFSPRKSLACINSEKITAFHGVPTMFIAMMNTDTFATTDFSHMRTGIMAGSPCPIKTMEDVVEKMHMTEITIVYGQTEASPGCTQSRVNDTLERRVNTVGKNLPGVECRIVDPETGEELPNGKIGEFVARGYNIMKGYYKMPQATAAAIDKDGWLHTGDLAMRDDDGYYKITGRIKDMVIRGGENIYPKEIEDFIYTHPKVSDVQVIGVPDAQYGEELLACVILKDGETMTEDEIKDYVKANMAKHKVPRYVRFVNSFPMNAAGKILKFKMREQAIELLGLNDANNIKTA